MTFNTTGKIVLLWTIVEMAGGALFYKLMVQLITIEQRTPKEDKKTRYYDSKYHRLRPTTKETVSSRSLAVNSPPLLCDQLFIIDPGTPFFNTDLV